jgi:hypothetical protein
MTYIKPLAKENLRDNNRAKRRPFVSAGASLERWLALNLAQAINFPSE